MIRNWGFYLGVLIVGIGASNLLLTARVPDLNASQKRDTANITPFDDENSYYQTFIPHSSNLCLIEFSLASSGYPRDYEFNVSMKLTDDEGKEIASGEYLVPHSVQVDTIRFSFAPQTDSLDRKYRLLLQTDAPPGLISLLGSEFDSYPAGELVFNNTLTDPGDLALFTYSKPNIPALIEKTVQNSAGRMMSLVLMTIIIWGIGNIITFFFLPDRDPIERVIHTLLTGIALPPVVFFILSLFRIRFAGHLTPAVLLILIFSAVLELFALRKKYTGISPASFQWKETIALCLLIILAFATRVAQIDKLIVPSGIGSQFHENAIERIDRRGEIPLDSIYHLGFHSNAALLSDLTKNTFPETILMYGQWLSIVSGLSFYLCDF